MAHVAPLQTGFPFCTAQTTPHAPQLFTSFRVARSQPSLTAALQFAKPVLHVIEHDPFVHLAVPLVESQAAPQPPQFDTSPDVSTSHPFESSPSQSAKGDTHDATLHEPDKHVSLAFGSEQALLQPPHSDTVFSRVSHPSDTSLLQSAKPCAQLATVQAPAAHPAVPLATKQAFPQPPQLPTLVAVSTSQPSEALPLQSASVPLQVEMPQPPATQFAVPARVGHSFVHDPQ